jgi:hypothetical protein
MKVIVLSCSLTGNNEILAANIAAEFKTGHVKINESKQRTMSTIVFDILFNRIPKVHPDIDKIDDSNMIIFVGPVWMGHVATPFRKYFKQLKNRSTEYAFVSISGGALGPNTKLADELKKRTGKEPLALIDLHIADLLPADPKPTRKDTSMYRIDDKDVKKLTKKIMKTLGDIIQE